MGGAINLNHGKTMKKAFTLIELLVVVAIIAILAALLLPSLQRSIFQARTVACLSNLHGWAVAAQVYANENDNKLPSFDIGVPTGKNAWDIASDFLPYMKKFGVTQDQWSCPVNRRTKEQKLADINPWPGFSCWRDYCWWVPRRDSSGISFMTNYPSVLEPSPTTNILICDQVSSSGPVLDNSVNAWHRYRNKIVNTGEAFHDGHAAIVPFNQIKLQYAGNGYAFY